MDMKTLIEYEAMAKLCLPEEERAWMLGRAHVLELSFMALSAVDTEDVEPLVTVLDMHNVLREDVAKKLMPREEILFNAPEQYEGYFQVPKTFE